LVKVKPMIRLTIPSLNQKELMSIKNVLSTGQLVQGQKVARFETLIARYTKVKYAIAVSSGTAALHLSLLAAGIGRGDEVIVPDFTYPATANVVELVGAKPVFVDIDSDTFNIDVQKIEKKINNKTRAIMPVHMFGLSAEMDAILKLSRKYGLRIIEDAACALGARYKGKACGSLGDMGCISFHPRKTITTGEGGMVITNNLNFAKKVRSLRNHGIERIGKKVDFVRPGYNYRMNELQAAIGIVQMEKIEKIIRDRRKIANVYDSFLKYSDWLRIPYHGKQNRHTYQSYVGCVANERINRDRLVIYLKRMGIEATLGTYSLHNVRYYQSKYALDKTHFPCSEYAYRNSISLPIYYGLSKKKIKFIASTIKNFY